MGCLRSFVADRCGSTATMFAFAAPIAIGLGAFAIDYSSWTGQQARLQAVADAAALAAAKELKLTRATNDHVLTIANGIVQANYVGDEARTVGVAAVTREGAVTVDLTQPRVSYFANVIGTFDKPLAATATARMVGAQRICVLALETTSADAIDISENGRLDGNGCSVTSNSRNPNGLRVTDAGRVSAESICSAGGVAIRPSTFVQPAPISNCPPLPDPLAARPQPSVGPCTVTTETQFRGTVGTLSPGVYCRDIIIADTSTVTMLPGLYILRGAELRINGTARVTGRHVGIFATGADSGVRFVEDATIDLGAPVTGPMAGILIREDSGGPTGSREFEFSSNNIVNMTGVIYLPRSTAEFESDQPIADDSPWTAIVANRIDIEESSRVVLNTNYGATDVPVPAGLATRNAKDIVSLTR